MSYTLESTYEATSPQLYKSRCKFRNSRKPCLGPDDLVSINKIESHIFSAIKLEVQTCHHLIGYLLEDPSNFAAYFVDLVDNSFSSSISKASLYVWNSFRNEDVRVTIIIPGGCHIEIILPDDQITELPESYWYEIFLSSSLRFYRALDPLTFSLFHSSFDSSLDELLIESRTLDGEQMSSPAAVVFSPPHLSLQDLQYCAVKHPLTPDFQSALSLAALINLDLNDLSSFLLQFLPTLPLLIPYLFRFIPPSSPLITPLQNSIINHLRLRPDDIGMSAFLMSSPFIEEKTTFIPILMSSLSNHPQAGFSLSRFSLFNQQYIDSLSFLNAGTLSSLFSKVLFSKKRITLISKSVSLTSPPINYPYGPSSSETRLISSFPSGIIEEFHSLIADLLRAKGNAAFLRLLRGFVENRPLYSRTVEMNRSSAEKLVKEAVCKPKFHQYKFFEEVRPKIIDDKDFLYDPGIEGDPKFPLSIENLPYSKDLQDAIDVVQGGVDDLQLYSIQKFDKNEDPKLISASIVLGLRLRDSELLGHLAQKIESLKIQLTELDQILLLKAMQLGILKFNDSIFEYQASKRTVTQNNTLVYMKAIVGALNRLASSIQIV